MGVKCANLRDDAVIGDRCPDCDHAVALHGRDRICDLCTELDPLNRIVALGPLTNLAAAVMNGVDLAGGAEVSWMGGTLEERFHDLAGGTGEQKEVA